MEDILAIAAFFRDQPFARIGSILSIQSALMPELGPVPTIAKTLQKRIVEIAQRTPFSELKIIFEDSERANALIEAAFSDFALEEDGRPIPVGCYFMPKSANEQACGTSGMKVLVNGGINLSELDGWWAEAYTPEVGWALGDGQEHDDDPAWDAVEADALYDLLESKVIPEFYTRDESGIPTAWVKRMRESMAGLTPRFSSNRSEREYTEQNYLPAATAYRSRAADKGAIGRQIVDWHHSLEQKWAALRFGEVKLETDGDNHVFEVQVYLADLDPKAVRVELCADGVMGSPPVRQEMKRIRPLAGATGGSAYGAAVSAARPAADYTARVIPNHDGVAVPLEDARILWQR